MSMNLAKKTYTTEPGYLIADAVMPIATATKTASAAVAAGQVLAISDGGVKPYSAAGDTLYGIASEAAAANEPVICYLTGDYFAANLAFAGTITASDVELAFRNIGIFLK